LALSKTAQKRFEAACQFQRQGKLEEAQRILEQLVLNGQRSAALFAVLGDVHWDRGSLDDAIHSFRKATEISPHSETASLGLFHTLWQDGQKGAAFDEARRFTKICDSEEYNILMKDLNR